MTFQAARTDSSAGRGHPCRANGRLCAGTAVALSLLTSAMLAGCGGGGDAANPAMSGLGYAAALALGERIAQDTEDSGDVVLIHAGYDEGKTAEWRNGLEKGLKSSVVEFGPEQMSEQARYSRMGFAALQEALAQHPDARALVTTLSIGAHERPQFPDSHPPVYALDWLDLSPAVYLFRKPDLAAGVFPRPDAPDAPSDLNADPAVVFDEMYVLVDQDSIRDLLRQMR